MTEIRYYSLIDCDSDGTEKVAMFPTLDYATIASQSETWLEEMVPHHFRLRAKACSRSTKAFHIRCPRCGNRLQQINETINVTQALFVCDTCVNS